MRRPATFLALFIAAATSLVLFTVSYQVHDLEERVKGLNTKIYEDRQAIHVLRAEWSHLNEPARLRALSERYLDLAPVDVEQVRRIDEIPWRVAPGVQAVGGEDVPNAVPDQPAGALTPVSSPVAREAQIGGVQAGEEAVR